MVYTLGKIKKDIYKCITKEIVAEDIIITDNQMQHIFDRHPDAFDQIIESMRNILENPDYIIKDEKHENTGLVIGRNRIQNKTSDSMELVLRVYTSGSEPGYQNSIISCWKISEKRLQNYLRNKRVLYSRE